MKSKIAIRPTAFPMILLAFLFVFTAADIVAQHQPPGSSMNGAIDLGEFDGTTVIRGELNDARSELFYKLTIGCGDCVEWERTRFDTVRKLTVTANSYGTSDDLGLELRVNPNADASGQVLSDSIPVDQSRDLIDSQELGSGVYYIRLFKKAPAASFSLSISIAPLPIHPDTAGNDPLKARRLGVLTGPRTYQDFIGVTDQFDFYAFELKKTGDLSVVLDGLHDADVELSVLKQPRASQEDEAENIYYSDFDGDSSEEIFIKDLQKGEYLLKVSQVSGNSDYKLSLEVGSKRSLDNAGASFREALDIGVLDKDRNLRGYQDEKNGVDVYSFRVNDAREAWISRRTFGALTAKMEILKRIPCDNPQGCEEVLEDSPSGTHWGTEDGTEIRYFNFMAIGTGEYFIRLQRESGAAPFELNVHSEPISDTAGDKLETAKSLPKIDQNTSAYAFLENVGKLDPVDLFRFPLEKLRGGKIKVCSLDRSAVIEVAHPSTPDNAIMRKSGCAEKPDCCAEMDLKSLEPGEYLLKIVQLEGASRYVVTINPPDRQ